MRIIEQSATILDWSGLDLYQRVEQAARVCRRSESKGDAEGFVRSLIRRGHLSPLEFARVEFPAIALYPILDWVSNIRRLREIAVDEEADEAAEFARQRLAAVAMRYPAFCEGIQLTEEDIYPFAAQGMKPANDWIPVLFVTSRTISHQLVRYRHDITFCQESQRHVRYDRDGIEVIEQPPMLNQHEWMNQLVWNAWNFAMHDAEGAYIEMMEAGATAEQARAVLPGCTATRILAYASPDEWRHIFSQRCDEHADPQMRALMIPLRDEMRERELI